MKLVGQESQPSDERPLLVEGLRALAGLPDAVAKAHPTAATLPIVRPLAIRAVGALAGDPVSDATAALLEEAIRVIGQRYAHLKREFKRLSGVELYPLAPAVVGALSREQQRMVEEAGGPAALAAVASGPGGLTAAVAGVLGRAWPVITRAAVAAGRLLVKHPVKTAVATAAAGALPSIYRAGKAGGKAVERTAQGLERFAAGAGGLAGAGLLLLLGLLLLSRRR